MIPRLRRPVTASIAAVISSIALVLATVASSSASDVSPGAKPLPVPYTLAAGIAAEALTPGASPPGANDFTCRPSAAHPRPVILLHGFAANMTESWQTVSPLLRNAGYCVFALTYGTYAPIDPSGRVGGLDCIENSASQLAAFVTKVRSATGARKVDLVGWSEGGWLARHYIQFLNGGKYVRNNVGFAPANGPTNREPAALHGREAAPRRVPAPRAHHQRLGRHPPCGASRRPRALRRTERRRRNVGQRLLHEHRQQVRRARATVLGVHPTGLHVRNIVLQTGCPIDFSDHVSIVSTRRATQFMLNALDPAHASRPPCLLALPAVG